MSNLTNLEKPSIEEFKQNINNGIKYLPNSWRYGQKVFNYIDRCFDNVARDVQLYDGVDCFYDDSKIDVFIEMAYKRIFVEIKD